MTPMIYKYEGAILAGQFGLTIGLVKTISSISSSWLDTKIPKMNMLVAHKDQNSLDTMFRKNALIGFVMFLFISIVFLICIELINIYNFHADRFLTLYLSSLMIALEAPNVIVGYLAKYLRAHKAEPYYVISVIMGVLFFFIISLLNLNRFSIDEIIILLNGVSWLIVLPTAIFIFKNFRLNYYKDVSYG